MMCFEECNKLNDKVQCNTQDSGKSLIEYTEQFQKTRSLPKEYYSQSNQLLRQDPIFAHILQETGQQTLRITLEMQHKDHKEINKQFQATLMNYYLESYVSPLLASYMKLTYKREVYREMKSLAEKAKKQKQKKYIVLMNLYCNKINESQQNEEYVNILFDAILKASPSLTAGQQEYCTYYRQRLCALILLQHYYTKKREDKYHNFYCFWNELFDDSFPIMQYISDDKQLRKKLRLNTGIRVQAVPSLRNYAFQKNGTQKNEKTKDCYESQEEVEDSSKMDIQQNNSENLSDEEKIVKKQKINVKSSKSIDQYYNKENIQIKLERKKFEENNIKLSANSINNKLGQNKNLKNKNEFDINISSRRNRQKSKLQTEQQQEKSSSKRDIQPKSSPQNQNNSIQLQNMSEWQKMSSHDNSISVTSSDFEQKENLVNQQHSINKEPLIMKKIAQYESQISQFQHSIVNSKPKAKGFNKFCSKVQNLQNSRNADFDYNYEKKYQSLTRSSFKSNLSQYEKVNDQKEKVKQMDFDDDQYSFSPNNKSENQSLSTFSTSQIIPNILIHQSNMINCLPENHSTSKTRLSIVLTDKRIQDEETSDLKQDDNTFHSSEDEDNSFLSSKENKPFMNFQNMVKHDSSKDYKLKDIPTLNEQRSSTRRISQQSQHFELQKSYSTQQSCITDKSEDNEVSNNKLCSDLLAQQQRYLQVSLMYQNAMNLSQNSKIIQNINGDYQSQIYQNNINQKRNESSQFNTFGFNLIEELLKIHEQGYKTCSFKTLSSHDRAYIPVSNRISIVQSINEKIKQNQIKQ